MGLIRERDLSRKTRDSRKFYMTNFSVSNATSFPSSSFTRENVSRGNLLLPSPQMKYKQVPDQLAYEGNIQGERQREDAITKGSNLPPTSW